MAGVLPLINKSRKGHSYFNSSKFLIVGPSGSGKTVLVTNLAIFSIHPYSNVVYVSPASSADDKTIVNFQSWCDKAKLPFFHCMVQNDSLNIPNIKHCLFIIDDYYTSTGRPPVVEKLIKSLFNRGRHDHNHVVYIAQCGSRLQPESLQNNNGIFIKSKILAEKFGLMEEKIPYIDEREWNLIKPNQDNKFVKIIDFQPIKSVSDVTKKLKSKIVFKQPKVAGPVEYKEIDSVTKSAVEKPKDPPFKTKRDKTKTGGFIEASEPMYVSKGLGIHSDTVLMRLGLI